ncbi:MAG: FAD:protein FMN transferase [Parcubacteria group bacterium]|jgi:thiamine biosynthesis lipoprotein
MKINFKALGTDISIQIISDNISNGLEEEIKNFYCEKEKTFSRFDKNSKLSTLNNNLGKYNTASSDIIEVAGKCLEYNKDTDGYFDPRIIEVLESIGYDKDFRKINSEEIKKESLDIKCLSDDLGSDLKIDGDKIYFRCRMDFSGIAKGYITDKLANYLQERGYTNFLIDSGGDIRISGKDENGENWKISLEGVAEEKILLELNNNFPAIATSGITRRKWENESGKFHHLINPKSPGEFNFNLKSATVVARTCEEADIWEKVLYLMGKENGIQFSEEKNIKSLFLDYKGNIQVSGVMKNNINING